MQNLNKGLDLESFWMNVFCFKNGLHENMFPLTKYFVGALLSLPHSNTIVSELALVKDSKLICLLNSTIHSICILKELLNNKHSDEWQPLAELLKKFLKHQMFNNNLTRYFKHNIKITSFEKQIKS